MKTSEIEKAIKGELKWKHLCSKYKMEKSILFSRKDGAAVSGDLKLSFDANEVLVTKEQIKILCYAALENEIELSDVQFLATAIVLSGFEFDNDNTEYVVHSLSTPNSETSFGFIDIQEAIHVLSKN